MISSSAASSSPGSNMDEGNTVQDPESLSVAPRSPLPLPLPLPLPQLQIDVTKSSWRQELYKALRRRDYFSIFEVLGKEPDAIRTPFGENRETLLVVAIKEGLRHFFIDELVDTMSPEDLGLRCKYGYNALHWAATIGDVQVARLLVKKNPDLPKACISSNGFRPIHLAAALGHWGMTLFLYEVNHECDKQLVKCAVNSGFYDFALGLLDGNPNLAKDSTACAEILEKVVGNPHAFLCGNRLNMFQAIIYYLRIVLHKVYSRVLETFAVAIGGVEIEIPARDLKRLKNYSALKLARNLLELQRENQSSENDLPLVFNVLLAAIQNGILDIVEEILKVFPDIVSYHEDERENVLRLAVLCREERIFNILHQKIPPNRRRIQYSAKNEHDENILHLVARLPRQQRLHAAAGSSVGLQMQRELQWYKGLEQLVPDQLRNQQNKDRKTPIEVFEEEHRKMAVSETGWMLSMANSCIVGGSLIATVVFAAAITVPGGNKNDGIPNFSNTAAFRVFAFSDTFALVSSLTAVVVFLSIFTSRYSINDFLYSLPNRLIVGLISMLLSVTFMMIAFSAIVYLVFAEDNEWIIFPIAAVASVPVIFFAKLQLPSLLNMMKLTYGRNILKRRGILKHRSYVETADWF